MKLAALLIIILSNQGYWLGGREGTITIREAARGGLPAADISWELMFASVRLGNGTIAMVPGRGDAVAKIAIPECRERIPLLWKYRVKARETGQLLDQGEVPIWAFPSKLLDGLAEHVNARHLIVWDKTGGIPKLLELATISFQRIDSESPLQFARNDVVLVGPDTIGASIFDQATLKPLVEAGASVMIFEQSKVEQLMGYRVSAKNSTNALEWQMDHPILRDFQLQDVRSWMQAAPRISAVQLPANEAALALGYFRAESPGNKSDPMDAVLLTRTLGAGRFVLCQIPLGDWSDDPRSQILLRNAIDYLLTRPQATSHVANHPQREPAAAAASIPTIPADSGSYR